MAAIRLRPLAALCRRLAIATNAGVDDRAIWAREADRAAASMQRPLRQVANAVAAGESIDTALAQTGGYFPRLFCEMVAVGQHTGSMGEVLRHLADHYEHQLRRRRIFLAALAWPAAQLLAAGTIVGLLIWIMGHIGQVDLLGFGLRGTTGLILYLLLVVGIGGGLVLLAEGIRRGTLGTAPVQRLALKTPILGRCLETIALARLTWTLHLTLNVEMDLRRLLPIALQSTGNPYYVAQTAQIVADIGAGREIHEAFRRRGVFPADFLQAVEVAEQSGRLVESMGHLSQQYDEQARLALTTLATVAGFAVWALVALVIVALIVRLFSFYVGEIMRAANP